MMRLLPCVLVGLTALAAALPAPLPAQAQDPKILRVAVIDSAIGQPTHPYKSYPSGIVDPREAVYDALFAISAEGALQPALALDATLESERVWRIGLRPDVAFADRTPVTAQNILENLRFLMGPEANRLILSQEMATVEAAELDENGDLLVTTASPDPLLPRRLAAVFIVPMERWRALGSDGFGEAPIGTGPFQFEGMEAAGNRLALNAYRESWRGAPVLDGLELIFLKDASARAQALMSDQVDMAHNITLSEQAMLERRGLSVMTRELAVITSIAFSNRDPDSPVADARVRRALNLAVNRSAMAEILLDGTTTPASQGAIPGVVGYNPDLQPYPYDPELARALLAEAGYPDGFPLTATILQGAFPEDGAIYQQIQVELAQIGVELELRRTVGPEWITMWFTGDWRGAQALYATWGAGRYMDAGRAMDAFSCLNPAAFFCDEAMADRLRTANAIMDTEERAAVLREIAADYHDLAPALMLYPITQNIAYAPVVQDIDFAGFRLRYETLDLAR